MVSSGLPHKIRMTPSSLPRHKYPKPYLFTILNGLLSIILISGCGLNQEEELYSKDEAEREFIRICQEEYDWDVNTKFIGDTFWIYIPCEQDMLEFKANRFPQINKCAVSYLKGDFIKERFYFEYQITPLLKSEKDKGYITNFNEELSEEFRYLLNVIYRVYFNTEQQPEFYVIVMADIVNGVEVIYTIYGLDLKKIYNNAIPSEEYYKRILQDIKGDLAIINDRTGHHLAYKEIKFGEFLAEQITQRIRIKFSGADFNLCKVPKEEILKIISYCLHTYEFRDFSAVTLRDLPTGAQATISRSALEEIKEF